MTYESNDLNLAGYLVASGCPLTSNRRHHGQIIFCFDQSDKLIELVGDYYNMQALVNPLSYGSALKILKSIIYQKDYNNNDTERMFHQQRRTY
jgi:hypothetical protein